MGPLALQQAFEIIYKCRGQVSDQLKQAIGIFVVHFCEAARIQSVLNDVCTSFRGSEVSTLDVKNPNSYWIKNWNFLARKGMERADLIDRGDTSPPYHNPDGAPVKMTSELQIFRQIRILPRDAYNVGIFKTEKRESPVFEGPLDDGSRGMRSGCKRSRSEEKERGKKRVSSLEDPSKGGGDGGCPSYSLLDDLGGAETGEDDLGGVKGKSNAQISGPADASISDYLDHFTMVKKMINLNRRTQKLTIVSSLVDRPAYPVVR